MKVATPLIASFRCRLEYPVLGVTHRAVKYCRVASGGAPGTFEIVDNASIAQSFQHCAQGFINTWGYLLSGSPVCQVTLEEALLDEWRYMDAYASTQETTGSATASPGEQLTLTVRDTNSNHVKVVFIEAAAPYVGHSADGLGISGPIDNFVNHSIQGFGFPSPSLAVPPSAWEVGRSNLYLAPGSVAGLTLSRNRKVARRRGLA